MNARIDMALTEIYDLNRQRLATVDYLAAAGIDTNAVADFCGSPTVLPITLLPSHRFDLPDHGAEAVDGMVIEARGEDGETVIDLCAWPISNPARTFARCLAERLWLECGRRSMPQPTFSTIRLSYTGRRWTGCGQIASAPR